MPHRRGIWIADVRLILDNGCLHPVIRAAINSRFGFGVAINSPFRHIAIRMWNLSDSARESIVPRSRDLGPGHSEKSPSTSDRIEYIVRPSDDAWMIEHDGDRYGPYKNSREAMFFAIDAARKLGALGKNTHVKMTDHAGHPLTTWNYGSNRNSAIF
jgi:hypothetical protein